MLLVMNTSERKGLRRLKVVSKRILGFMEPKSL